MKRRPLLRTAAAVGAAATALAGCGATQWNTPAAGVSVSVSAPAGPSAATGGAPLSPAPLPSGTTTADRPITRPVTLSADGRTVTATTTVAGCQQARLLTRESSTAVTVTLQLETRRPNGMACPDYVRISAVQAVLQAPLGHRTAIDGTTGKQLTVTHQ